MLNFARPKVQLIPTVLSRPYLRPHMSTSTATAKRCVNCNKDVSGDKRMKDSSGKYWCLKCGEADKAKKGQTGTACGICGERYPAAKLTRWGKDRVCPSCYKSATKGGGVSFGGGGGEGSKGRLVKMIAVMALLAGVAVWRFMTLHS
jgi:hypothetical protein